jgi:hypothetical protein
MSNVKNKQQRKDSESLNSDKDKAKQYSCLRCKELVESEGVGCDICENWFHYKCEDLSREQYAQMVKPETKFMHWFCKDCEKDTLSLGKTINAMKVKQDKMEAELLSLRQTVNSCSSELKARPTKPEVAELVKSTSTELKKEIDLRPTKAEVLNIIETKLAEHVANTAEKEKQDENTWADIAAKHVDTKMSQVTVNLNEVQKTLEDTKKKALEEKERETRSNNIVIYRVPETSDPSEERIKQDKHFCISLLKDALEVDLGDGDIKKIFRLGKREASTTAARPILIQLRERGIKNRVMESLYKLKHAEDKFKNVSITHDLTLQERSECKALVIEAKSKQDEEKGEWLWRVRGAPGLMKIVRIAKR